MTITSRNLWRAVLFLLIAFIHDAGAFLVNFKASNSFLRLPIRGSATTGAETKESAKDQMLRLISSTPSNAPTSNEVTNVILAVVRELEAACPTPDSEVVQKLRGNWELLWTAQDQSSDEWAPLRRFINPLENQAYSNNPNSGKGRANPVLPREVQDRLEYIGLVGKDAEPVRSSQAIDLKKGQVRNVVAFTTPSFRGSRKATLTVTLDFKPYAQDKRRVDVKFRECRIAISKSPVDFSFPLGIIGPRGWLRTGYIDETMRITRGHKGSIFVLTRPSKQ